MALTARAPVLAVAFAAGVGGGCGLAPHESASTPFPSDGVSGFGAPQPVEVCLGAARLVAPAAEAGATSLCVEDGRNPIACSSDGQCQGIEHCICGRCIVQACEGPGSCTTDEVCRGSRCTKACIDDAGCAAGERCVGGGCARKCSSDKACYFGEQCDALDGACASSTCNESVGCGIGATCSPEQRIGEVREPTLVTGLDGVGFFELRDAMGPRIFRARLVTTLSWSADPVEPVLGDASASFGAPSATASGGRIDLYVARPDGSGIEHATSTDGGATFSRDAAPLLVPESAWEAGRVASPSVFDKAGHRYLVYEGGAGAGLGIAEIAASGATRLRSEPIATPSTIDDPVFWRGVTRIGSPAALVDDSVVRIYFTGRGAEGSDAIGAKPLPAERNDSIGLITTSDFTHVDRYPTGPAYARVANLQTYLGEEEPSVRVTPDGAELYFVAADAAGHVAGLARAGF